MTYNVRKVRLEDVPVCVALCYKFLQEAEYLKFTGFNIEDATNFGMYLTREEKEGIALLLEIDSKIVGVIAGVLSPCLWNQDVNMCWEMFWWVEPEHRGTKASFKLLKEFEKEAHEQGATHIAMASIPSLNGNKPGNYYKRQGYEERELFFTKEL